MSVKTDKPRPQAFDGQRVIVVGLGNSGGDTVDALIGHASHISLSHNGRGIVI